MFRSAQSRRDREALLATAKRMSEVCIEVLNEPMSRLGFSPNFPLGEPGDPTEVTVLYESDGREFLQAFPQIDRGGLSETEFVEVGVDLYIQFDLIDSRLMVSFTVGEGTVLNWATTNGYQDLVEQANSWDRSLKASAGAIAKLAELMLDAYRP